MTAQQSRNGIALPTFAHAVSMLVAILLAMALDNLAVLAVAAMGVFALRVWWERGIWLVHRRFGPANWITALRIALTCVIALLPTPVLVPWGGVLILVVFALDGIDGWLARRTDTVSDFGAAFDQEADAFMIALVGLAVYRADLAGAWILVAGFLRYVYVVAVWGFGSAKEAPRSLLGRVAFGVLVIGLLSILLIPSAWTRAFLAAASVGLFVSFARAFWWSWLGAKSGSEACELPGGDIPPAGSRTRTGTSLP